MSEWFPNVSIRSAMAFGTRRSEIWCVWIFLGRLNWQATVVASDLPELAKQKII